MWLRYTSHLYHSEEIIFLRKYYRSLFKLPPHTKHKLGLRTSLLYLCRNSWKGMRLGKPCLQIRIPSRTPLHRSWSRTSGASILPARFSWFGMMHRTKLGFVFLSVTMSFASCSLYSCDTVLNMPLRVRAPNWVSVRACCAMPTISAGKLQLTVIVPYLNTSIHVILFVISIAQIIHYQMPGEVMKSEVLPGNFPGGVSNNEKPQLG